MNTDELEKHGFTLQGKIRETGYAVTYQALQQSLGRNVQLRLLKPEYEDRPDVVAYFLDIGRLLAHAKSDKVISVFDIISTPGCHCIVTEATTETTLQEELDAGATFTRQEALTLVLQTAEGVAFLWAHFNLVLHNLSAASLRRDVNSGIKITEFEQADRSEETDGLMPCDDMIGLGSLLHRLCAGADGRLPEDIAAVKERLLSQDPQTRFLGWDAVLESLRGLLAADGTPRQRNRMQRTVQGSADTAKPLVGIFAEDERQRQEDRRRHEAILWLLLAAWFAGLFWFRSSPSKTALTNRVLAPVRQAKEQVQEVISSKLPAAWESADEKGSQAAVSDEALPAATTEEPEKSEPDVAAIAAQRKLVALFLDQGLLEAQKAAASDPALPDRIKAVFRQAPSQKELLRKRLEPKIGKTLPLQYGGKKYDVKIVSVNEDSLSLEARGRSIDLPFGRLGIKEKVDWIGNVETPEETLALCELLLSIGQKKEAVDRLFQDTFFRPFVEIP
ncbi:MAG: hypothetical protein J5985_00590 [Kiritimatiellae bacterium]|nr:hypothetical protein [Kiritimatiellia bacterium]